MADLRKCWMSESTRGPRGNRRLLVPPGNPSHSCFPISWTLGGIAGELRQLHGTNTSLCISQQCLEAPRGIGGPTVLICRSDPEGQ